MVSLDLTIKDRTLLTYWGLTVSTGWLVSFLVHSFVNPLTLVAIWSVLMSLPVIASIAWVSQKSTDHYLPIPWVVVTGLSLALAFAVVQGSLIVPGIDNYAMFWFFLPAAAFSITTFYFEGLLNHLYISAAFANFVMAFLVLFRSDVIGQYYIMAAFLQGLPLVYHAYYEF